MNRELLQRKVQSISALASSNGTTARRFAEGIEELSDWELIRINPLLFAEKTGISSAQAVEFFVLGAKVGLVDFLWHLICPWCGGIADRCSSLDQLHNEPFYCIFCDADMPNTLDKEVETAFAINPELKVPDVDPLSSMKNYYQFYFSPNLELSPELDTYFRKIMQGYAAIEPDEQGEFEIQCEPDITYRFISLDRHSTLTLSVEPEAESGEVEMDLLPSGYSTTRLEVPRGNIKLRIRNLGDSACGVILIVTDDDIFHRILVEKPVRRKPFLTGKMLLNNQVFRDVFKMESLRSDLKLDIRSLVLLFTDLKGSTWLYDSKGDGLAYELIQEHFKELGAAVVNHGGAIIKTMGDAIMASFSSPEEGLGAAIEMMSRMVQLNKRLKDRGAKLGLKVGLHQGPTLAVNANDKLDYFGQTVNIASRVQQLAKAGEIWFTEPIEPASNRLDKIYPTDRHEVRLRGVDQDTVVYRIRTDDSLQA